MLNGRDPHRGVNVERLAEMIVENPKFASALLDKVAEKIGLEEDDYAQYGLIVAANLNDSALELIKAMGHAASLIRLKEVFRREDD